jgi:nitrogen fixation NifU-like protein
LKDPQNRGHLPNANGLGESHFPKCGDHLILQLRVADGRIQEARFLARACGPVVAVASLATTWLAGMSVDQARKLSWQQLDQELGGLPPPKRHALWMLLEALLQALDIQDVDETKGAPPS